jgi:hypothetical protein
MPKCNICDNKAVFQINNPGAEVQRFCNEHLPWFINRVILPAHVQVLNEPKPEPVKEDKAANESRKNSNKASTPGTDESAPAEGSLPA